MDVLVASLDAAGIAVSMGAACSSGTSKPSPTLVALYGDRALASLRLSLGHLVQASDLDRIVGTIAQTVERTRAALAI